MIKFENIGFAKEIILDEVHNFIRKNEIIERHGNICKCLE